MTSTPKTLVITGFTSEIAKAFLEIALSRTANLNVLRCGRSAIRWVLRKALDEFLGC